jgi:hypothetical protein
MVTVEHMVNFLRFKEQLLPNIPANYVICMDNAPYHSVVTSDSKIPSKKADIQRWLSDKGINQYTKCFEQLIIN